MDPQKQNFGNNNFGSVLPLVEINLLNSRNIFVFGDVDKNLTTRVIKELLFLDALEPGKEITMIINTPGGFIYDGLGIYDAMRTISSPIKTVGIGAILSVGALLLSSGEPGRRFVHQNSNVMIHQLFVDSIGGRVTDIKINVKQMDESKKRMIRILSQNTGKSVAKVAKDIETDNWMTAEEAIKYSLADHLISHTDKTKFKKQAKKKAQKKK